MSAHALGRFLMVVLALVHARFRGSELRGRVFVAPIRRPHRLFERAQTCLVLPPLVPDLIGAPHLLNPVAHLVELCPGRRLLGFSLLQDAPCLLVLGVQAFELGAGRVALALRVVRLALAFAGEPSRAFDGGREHARARLEHLVDLLFDLPRLVDLEPGATAVVEVGSDAFQVAAEALLGTQKEAAQAVAQSLGDAAHHAGAQELVELLAFAGERHRHRRDAGVEQLPEVAADRVAPCQAAARDGGEMRQPVGRGHFVAVVDPVEEDALQGAAGGQTVDQERVQLAAVLAAALETDAPRPAARRCPIRSRWPNRRRPCPGVPRSRGRSP